MLLTSCIICKCCDSKVRIHNKQRSITIIVYNKRSLIQLGIAPRDCRLVSVRITLPSSTGPRTRSVTVRLGVPCRVTNIGVTGQVEVIVALKLGQLKLEAPFMLIKVEV